MAQAIASLERTIERTTDTAISMGHWILASLLALNTGAGLAALSVLDKIAKPVGPPIISFSVGAVLAIMIGMNGQLTALRVGRPIGEALELLRLDAITGILSGATRQKLAAIAPIVRQQLIASSLLAAGSILSFAVGIGLAVN
jgi:hypothetical protein